MNQVERTLMSKFPAILLFPNFAVYPTQNATMSAYVSTLIVRMTACTHIFSNVEGELSPLRNVPLNAFEVIFHHLLVVVADRRVSDLVLELERRCRTKVEVLDGLADDGSPSVVSETEIDLAALLVRMRGRAPSVSSKTVEHISHLY